MWNYYWGLTAAQIDLLAIDSPIIVYDKKDKKGKQFKKVNPLDYAKAQVEWESKYSGKEDNKVYFDFKPFKQPENNNTNTEN